MEISKRKRREIYKMLDEVTRFTDWEDKIEMVMEDYEMSRDDAEAIVWNWSIDTEEC